MNALDELIEAVEADGPDFSESTFGLPDKCETLVARAFNGSLDAALALHEALLPGWDYNLAPGFARVFPEHEGRDQEAAVPGFGTPAQPWLLVILRAYRQASA